MLSLLLKSDVIGAAASGLCAVHCVATPFLFVAQTCPISGCCETSPEWWSSIDYLFVGITAVAVYHSGSNSSKSWVKYSLAINWIILTLLIVNEKFTLLPISEILKYIAAFGLIALHVYNLKFCNCNDESCYIPQHDQ